jgi:hypothetical protein
MDQSEPPTAQPADQAAPPVVTIPTSPDPVLTTPPILDVVQTPQEHDSSTQETSTPPVTATEQPPLAQPTETPQPTAPESDPPAAKATEPVTTEPIVKNPSVAPPPAEPTPPTTDTPPNPYNLPLAILALTDDELKQAAAYYLKKNQAAISQKGVAKRQAIMSYNLTRIFDHITRQGPSQIPHMARVLDLSPKLLSHYLQILVKQNKIQATGWAKTRTYRPSNQ